MGGRGHVSAAIAALLGAAVAAHAQSADPEQFLLFSGADFWRGGGFGHAGLIWSPEGLDREGFAVKSMLGTGTYQYRRNGQPVLGVQTVAAIMPGWHFIRGKFELGLFAGLDVQHHQLIPDDPDNRLRGTHAGIRAGADLWWQPSADIMVSAAISASTIGTGYWARGATGWRFFDALYLGPEIIAAGDTTYRQFRLGAHATGFRTGAWEWSAGAGWVTDSDKRAGIYTRIGVLTRR